ncbi:MAG: flavodoxin family protein [Pirellulaceae bacterium]
MSIRIVGISSSPRHANTELLVKHALAAAEEKYGASTEFISFKGKKVLPCLDCKACVRRRTGSLLTQCILEDDWSELARSLVDPVPNGVIIGSPVYFFDANAALRAFMERFTSIFKPFWNEEVPYTPPDFTRTAAGAVAIGFHRHGGQETTISTIANWLLISGFLVVGSCDEAEGPVGYNGGSAWQEAGGVGGTEAVLNDEWGLRSARIVGERVAKTALLLAAGAEALASGDGAVQGATC